MKYEGNHEHTIKELKRIKKYRNDKGAKNVTGARVIDAVITVVLALHFLCRNGRDLNI